MKELLNKTVAVNDTTQIGVPFGKSYFKPTPKKLRVLGDSIQGFGTLLTVIGAVKGHPVFAVIASVCGWLGKTITNCGSLVDDKK